MCVTLILRIIIVADHNSRANRKCFTVLGLKPITSTGVKNNIIPLLYTLFAEHSALSLEEKRLLESLDRLNERLKGMSIRNSKNSGCFFPDDLERTWGSLLRSRHGSPPPPKYACIAGGRPYGFFWLASFVTITAL